MTKIDKNDDFAPYIDRIDCAIKKTLENEPLLLSKPCQELASRGGKRLRPLLMTLYYEMLTGEVSDDVINTSLSIELTHTASLIHDDIEDLSPTRRGLPALYISEGVDTAINTGAWLYFLAALSIENAKEDKRARLYRAFNMALKRLHTGQARDIYYHKNKDFPTIEEYKELVRGKTGSLFSLATLMASIMAGVDGVDNDKAKEAGLLLGEGFQILDDAINLKSGNKGKAAGDDITEGKKSYPILLHLEKSPADKDLILNYFSLAKNKEHTLDIDPTVECIRLLNSTDSVERAYEIGRDTIKKALEQMTAGYDNRASALIYKLFMDLTK